MSWDGCPQRCIKDSLFSTNPREILTVGCVRCNEDEREHKFLGENQENLSVEVFRRDSTPPV